MKILVTGGAGFIGTHLVKALCVQGHEVTVFDSLDPQVHGASPNLPSLPENARFIQGDVRDRDRLRQALCDVEVVFHEAAAVGVGQSMYEIEKYVDVNVRGTAVLLDLLVNDRSHRVGKLIVACSMSEYGEGLYQCPVCGPVSPGLRDEAMLKEGQWEPQCPSCSGPVQSVPTAESTPLNSTSVYALSKRDQEDYCLQVGSAYRIPVVGLRYFNVFGPGQSLSNPYTGVLAIFASRVLNGHPPVVYEDGRQTRDFVFVEDVVRANLAALKREGQEGVICNIGTGSPQSLLDIGRQVCEALGSSLSPEVTGRYRVGDVRHCYADRSRAQACLGFQPQVSFHEGLKKWAEWVKEQHADDRFQNASEELARRGLVR